MSVKSFNHPSTVQRLKLSPGGLPVNYAGAAQGDTPVALRVAVISNLSPLALI
ncbi:MAG: hypothetical protein MUC60_19315 [Oscillatoria sp. Prado101]|jgi:hypothetical protein|nr:hypothetical protein [Oscillatoria sp. Prado101]